MAAEWLTVITGLAKLTPKVLGGLAVAGAGLLAAGALKIPWLPLPESIQNGLPWVTVGTFLCGGIYLAHWAGDRNTRKEKKAEAIARKEERFANLTALNHRENLILAYAISMASRSTELPFSSTAAHSLMRKGLLEPVPGHYVGVEAPWIIPRDIWNHINSPELRQRIMNQVDIDFGAGSVNCMPKILSHTESPFN